MLKSYLCLDDAQRTEILDAVYERVVNYQSAAYSEGRKDEIQERQINEESGL